MQKKVRTFWFHRNVEVTFVRNQGFIVRNFSLSTWFSLKLKKSQLWDVTFFRLITKSCGWHFLKYIPCVVVDWSGDWATPWGLAIEERRLKSSRPVITPSWPTSCCCRYVSTTLSRKKHPVAPSGSSDAPRKLCSARKRSVSGKCFICSESKASATNVLSVAKAKRQLQMFYL